MKVIHHNEYSDDSDRQQSLSSLYKSKDNIDGNSSNTTLDKYFYSFWRNNYILRCIRNKVLENINIKIDFEYLNDNYQYLSLLSDKDKMDNNIYFKIELTVKELSLFSNNSNKHLINSIGIHTNREEQGEINCDLLYEGLLEF